MADVQVRFGADVSDVQTALESIGGWLEQLDAQANGLAGGASAAFGEIAESAQTASSSIQEVASGTEKFQETLETFVSTASGIAAGFGLVEAAARVGEAFREATTGTAEWAERLQNMSATIGVSTDELQELQGAGQLAGVNLDRLQQFAIQLQRRLAEAGTGSKQLQGALLELGLVPADFDDLNTGLLKISASIQRLGGDTPMVREAIASLGSRGSMGLEPLLQNLPLLEANVKSLGAVISSEGVESASAFREAINELEVSFEALGHNIGTAVAPVGTALTEALTAVLNTGEFIIEAMNAAVSGVLEQIVTFALTVGREITDALTGNFGRMGSDLENGAKEFANDWHTALARIGTDAKDASSAIDVALGAGEARKPAIPKPVQGPSGPLPQPAKAPTAGSLDQEILAQAKAQEDALLITKATDAQELALGEETASQHVAQEQALGEQLYEIQLAALQKELTVAGQKPTKIAEINAQITELDEKYAASKIAQETSITEAIEKETDARAALAAKSAESTLSVQETQLKTQTSVAIQGANPADTLAAKQNELTQELGLANQKLTIRQNELGQELAAAEAAAASQGGVLSTESTAYQKYVEGMLEAENDFTKQQATNVAERAALNQKAAQDMYQQYAGVLDQLEGAFSKAFEGYLTGEGGGSQRGPAGARNARGSTGGAAGPFEKMGQGLELSLITDSLKDALLGGSGGIGSMIFGAAGKGGGLFGGLSSMIPGMPGGGLGGMGEVGSGIKQLLGLFGLGGGGGGVAQSPQLAAITLNTSTLALNTTGIATNTAAIATLTSAMAASAGASAAGGLGGLTNMIPGGGGGGGGGWESMLMSGLSVGSMLFPFFERGGVVPSAAGGMLNAGGGTMAMLHPNEMVLPAHLSKAVQDGANANRGQGPGGNVNFSPNINANAIDGRGMREALSGHMDWMLGQLMDLAGRKGGRLRGGV